MNETSSQKAYTHQVMFRHATWLLCVFCLLPATATAELAPAKGRLLVATEAVSGDLFGETVILLLEYGESGAMGLVVNRPTEVELGELLEDTEQTSNLGITIFWGGPVEMDTLSALASSEPLRAGMDEIVNSVYRIPFDDALEDARANPGTVRFYLGYAGWAAGQLDYELARGSWHVLPASDEIVFTDDAKQLWQRLKPPTRYRATRSVQQAGHAAAILAHASVVPE